MTGRRLAALLAVPLLLAAAWMLGGALFTHPPLDVGGVVVVPAGDRPPATAPAIGASTQPGDPATRAPALPAPGTATPAPPGATRVTNGPAPTAGDDDDDDGIDDDCTDR
ncbi:hypothetical protein FHR83_001949 [Actinoplanes campanulatus]|uniref:Uncharacterized protein n=1 Tax=Actinoplanes campanulatus TaxID=113559 RepID=A0A7W5ADZ0_9ACTN|nr:hypothetical protein [Actinoplanes campanulatus]MBB3094297.1 hypothetical protein [Actinoplanes campanulatus]GGN20057.1 hypothetical protein GCM10010109_33650 [Actinoplanes campanulatus]GID35784.1 hypothetical protein Aca09nite_22900 [Actinoplanes campanulatus]